MSFQCPLSTRLSIKPAGREILTQPTSIIMEQAIRVGLELNGNKLITGIGRGVGARRWGQTGRWGADHHMTVYYSMYKLSTCSSSLGDRARVIWKSCLWKVKYELSHLNKMMSLIQV